MRARVAGSWLVALLTTGCTSSDNKPADTDVSGETDTTDTDVAPDTDTQTDSDPVLDTDTGVVDEGELNPCGKVLATVTAGTGSNAYTAVLDGVSLELVHGGQGGWHFWLGLSATHTPQYVAIEHTIVRPSDGLTLSPNVRENVVLVPGVVSGKCLESGTYFGMQGRMDFTVLAGASGDTDDTDIVADPSWTDICGQTLRADLRLLWPRCARYEGTVCAEREDVVLGEDSVTFVAQPDPGDGPHCAL